MHVKMLHLATILGIVSIRTVAITNIQNLHTRCNIHEGMLLSGSCQPGESKSCREQRGIFERDDYVIAS